MLLECDSMQLNGYFSYAAGVVAPRKFKLLEQVKLRAKRLFMPI